MILPTKHISTAHSLLGVGALILTELKSPRTITSLWESLRTTDQVGTFDRFLLTLDMLFIIGAVELRGGLLARSMR
ncbi:hypothetical protein BH09SUM1_BH09SUM1_01110 [soil metagenome]